MLFNFCDPLLDNFICQIVIFSLIGHLSLIHIYPKTFGDILTMSGTKVETIDPISDEVSGVITGKIVKIEKHPDADKLVVCQIDVAAASPLTIVTSATNVFEGAVVQVAVENSVVAGGHKMSRTDFRGIMSYGMMCSVEELGMNTDLFTPEIKNGIYILPENTELGVDCLLYTSRCV